VPAERREASKGDRSDTNPTSAMSEDRKLSRLGRRPSMTPEDPIVIFANSSLFSRRQFTTGPEVADRK
jgi:hypothetical protein